MSLPQYPYDDFDQGRILLEQLGSFWVGNFGDSAQLQALLHANANVWAQTHLNLLESAAAVSRFTIPVFHTENWYLFTLLKSEADAQASLYQPDDLVYGNQPPGSATRAEGFIQTYGGVDRADVVQAPLPDLLAEANFTLQNLVVYPSKVWVCGIDYKIDKARNTLVFRDNPFTDPLVPRRDVVNNLGQKVDEEIALWVYKGSFDLDLVYTQFGYALGLQLKSSEGYKQLLNSLWDMYLQGASLKHLNTFLMALSGAPMAIDPKETVECVRIESTSVLIVTSSRVYRAALNANIIVSPGDIIHAGDPLTDAIKLTELAGANKDYSALPMLSLSTSLMTGAYTGELVFKNHDVSLDYMGVDSDNRAIVRFAVSGFPGDVELFWDMVQNLGKNTMGPTKGLTLANLLDTRVNKVGEPTALALPTTINPLKFVLDNLLCNNLFVIRVNLDSLAPDAPGLALLQHLRDVIPAHTTFVVFVQLPEITDVVDLSAVGNENAAGAGEGHTEYQTAFIADAGAGIAAAIADHFYEISDSPGGGAATYQDGVVTVKLVSLDCIG